MAEHGVARAVFPIVSAPSTPRLLVVAALVVGWSATTADAKPRAHHTRFVTDHGPVHVWQPAHYERETAGIVVYVHGYFTNVDDAWRRHRLARQFARSGINALFVACEAPIGPRQAIAWTSIDELLATIAAHLEAELPPGRIVAVGHSGAHRTISAWLDDGVDTIALIDAMYGELPGLRDWLESSTDRRLIDVAATTRRWSDELHDVLAETLVFERFPHARNLPGARDARIVYVRTRLDHMELVTGGVALPMILRALQLPKVSRVRANSP